MPMKSGAVVRFHVNSVALMGGLCALVLCLENRCAEMVAIDPFGELGHIL